MKIIPNKIKSLFDRKNAGISRRALTHPDRDWRVLIGLFVVTLAAIVMLHYILYLKLDVAPPPVQDTTSSANQLHKTDLAKLAGEYRAKKDIFDGLMNSRPAVVDPAK